MPDLTPSPSTRWAPIPSGATCWRSSSPGTPLTLTIGLIAGIIGLGVGTVLGFLSGYYGGYADTAHRGAADSS